MINGRQHYPIHWDYPHYDDEYVDVLYVQKMEDILKSKCNHHPPGEVPVSPEQCKLAAFRRQEALKQVRKSRVLCRTQLKESSSKRWRIVKEDDTLDLNIDPFSDELPKERVQASQKRPPKPPPEERLQASQKRPPKPPPEERLKHATLQEGEEEDVQASWKKTTQATTGRKDEISSTARNF